jgi:hypothetical protein
MNIKDFESLLESRITKTKDILSSKSKEYSSGGDKLYNFRRAAEILRCSPQKALLGMLMKHLVSVIDLIEGNTPLSYYLINEKIGDSINYLILLEAILTEELAIRCIDCDECSNSERRT